MKDFILWLIDNRCFDLNLLIDKLDRINLNTWFHDYYIFDHNKYLFNKGQREKLEEIKIKKKIPIQQIQKNKYRLDEIEIRSR